MGMWFFLFTELLLFGGLFLLYSVFRSKHSQAFHDVAKELDLMLGTINTIVLITSSLTMALSISFLRRGDKRRSVLLQAATIALGLTFLVIKYFEWGAKIDHGIYPDSPALLTREKGYILFYGLYFVMTGLHGLHVLAGLVLIGVMLFFTQRGRVNSAGHVRLENSGLYWHFVDVVWIYLFPLFYLIT